MIWIFFFKGNKDKVLLDKFIFFWTFLISLFVFFGEILDHFTVLSPKQLFKFDLSLVGVLTTYCHKPIKLLNFVKSLTMFCISKLIIF